MPGHVPAADAPEDVLKCQECGWTYPSHHPSAKHRRNHKKYCGKIAGFEKKTDFTLGPQVGNSCEDKSSVEPHPSSPQGKTKSVEKKWIYLFVVVTSLVAAHFPCSFLPINITNVTHLYT
jgi:hypothetical protein